MFYSRVGSFGGRCRSIGEMEREEVDCWVMGGGGGISGEGYGNKLLDYWVWGGFARL